MPDDPHLAPVDVEPELPFTAESFGMEESNWTGLLEQVLADESERIDAWSTVTFGVETTTETLNGSDAKANSRDLVVSGVPIQAVESITVDGESLSTDSYYAAEAHIEHLNGGWPDGRRNIDIEYEYGYDELPGPVRDGLIRLVRSRLEQRKTDGLESESSGDTSYTYRPSREIRAEVAATVRDHQPTRYTYDIGGALI